MAKQTINIGSAPDDGTGDTLRAGGNKINDNFDELYDADTALDGRVTALEGAPAGGDMLAANNLSDVADVGDARDNLDVYSRVEVDAIAGGGGGGSTTLAGLTDVDLTGAATGDVLTKHEGGDWVASPPTGGGGLAYGYAANGVGTNSTTAFASRGVLVVPIYAMSVKSVGMQIAVVTGYTMRAGIYAIDGSNNITGVVAETPTKSVTTTSASKIFFDFSSPVSLSAGSRYALLFTRTDATGNINTYAGSGDATWPVEGLSTYLRVDSSAPGVGTALASGSNPYFHGVIFAIA